MGRRILSADAALLPNTQQSLHALRSSLPEESKGGLAHGAGNGATATGPGNAAVPAVHAALQARWLERPRGLSPQALFDWDDRRALLDEIAFVNRAQSMLDEASVKIAPSVLKIVLTVKQHLPDPSAQRAFLADHLTLDFRRISELCIVADSYCLLDPARRAEGEQEIVRYGWSKALKLAHVPDPHERRDTWRRACAGADAASYRAVLEEIRRLRERKPVGPAAEPSAPQGSVHDVAVVFSSTRDAFTLLERALDNIRPASRESCALALREVSHLKRELDHLRSTLQHRVEALPLEAMADELAREA